MRARVHTTSRMSAGATSTDLRAIEVAHYGSDQYILQFFDKDETVNFETYLNIRDMLWLNQFMTEVIDADRNK